MNPYLNKFSGVSLPSLPPGDACEECDEAVQEIVEDKIQINNNSGRLEASVTGKVTVLDVGLSASVSDSQIVKRTQQQNEAAALHKSKSDGSIVASAGVDLEKRLRDLLSDDQVASSESSSVYGSVHDYENIASINVNRTDWGVRHWSTYSDIEASYHDNSVCPEREQCSLTSGSDLDASCRPLVTDSTSKISIQDAIAQLKSLASCGYNIYQPEEENIPTGQMPDLYECLWNLNPGGDNSGVVFVPAEMIKPCPTTGHNLSTITEVSEGSNCTSTSSLVRTVDTLMDSSVLEERHAERVHQEDLTYVEVSFLSKLDTQRSDRPRQLPVSRENFEMPGCD